MEAKADLCAQDNVSVLKETRQTADLCAQDNVSVLKETRQTADRGMR